MGENYDLFFLEHTDLGLELSSEVSTNFSVDFESLLSAVVLDLFLFDDGFEPAKSLRIKNQYCLAKYPPKKPDTNFLCQKNYSIKNSLCRSVHVSFF